MSNQHLRSIPILLATGKDKNARVTFLSFSLLMTHHDRQVFDNKNLPSLKRYLLLLLWSKTKRWQKHLSLVCSCREYTYNFKPVADKIKADFNLKNRLMPVLALHLPTYLPTYIPNWTKWLFNEDPPSLDHCLRLRLLDDALCSGKKNDLGNNSNSKKLF